MYMRTCIFQGKYLTKVTKVTGFWQRGVVDRPQDSPLVLSRTPQVRPIVPRTAFIPYSSCNRPWLVLRYYLQNGSALSRVFLYMHSTGFARSRCGQTQQVVSSKPAVFHYVSGSNAPTEDSGTCNGSKSPRNDSAWGGEHGWHSSRAEQLLNPSGICLTVCGANAHATALSDISLLSPVSNQWWATQCRHPRTPPSQNQAYVIIRQFADFFNTYQLETAENSSVTIHCRTIISRAKPTQPGLLQKIGWAGIQEFSSFSDFFAYVANRRHCAR